MMPDLYPALAPIYDTIGMSDFARDFTPRLIDYLQVKDWVGRRAADLGCGSGASTRWLANRGYAVTAVDLSQDMLDSARRTMPTSGLSLEWVQGDLRTVDLGASSYDLVLALDVLPEMNSLRDLEQMFAAAYRLLEPGKLFVFDMYTIRGLTMLAEQRDRIIHDEGIYFVMTSNDYDHDRQMLNVRYRIFHREDRLWERVEARRTLRGFPVQATTTLLHRMGFEVTPLMTELLNPFDNGDRAIFIARKPLGAAQ